MKLDGPTATFAFKDPDFNGDAAIKAFYNSAQVPANEYADAQKRVRDLMWEAKRQGSSGTGMDRRLHATIQAPKMR